MDRSSREDERRAGKSRRNDDNDNWVEQYNPTIKSSGQDRDKAIDRTVDGQPMEKMMDEDRSRPSKGESDHRKHKTSHKSTKSGSSRGTAVDTEKHQSHDMGIIAAKRAVDDRERHENQYHQDVTDKNGKIRSQNSITTHSASRTSDQLQGLPPLPTQPFDQSRNRGPVSQVTKPLHDSTIYGGVDDGDSIWVKPYRWLRGKDNPSQEQYADMIRSLEKERDDARNLSDDLKKKLQEQEDESRRKLVKLSHDNEDLRDARREQTKEIRQVQELMLTKKKKNRGGLTDEDKTVRENFKKLQSKTQEWGKAWATDNIHRLENLSDQDIVAAELAKVIRIDNGKLPSGLFSTRVMIKRSPGMCLSALLYNKICDAILEKPFRSLDSLTRTVPESIEHLDREGDTIIVTDEQDLDTAIQKTRSRLGPADGAAIERVYHELELWDHSRAQQWRCQTLDILDPSAGDSGFAEETRKKAKQQRENFVELIKTEFLKKHAVKALTRVDLTAEEDHYRTQQLRDILQLAAELSAKQWKQPMILRCTQLNGLLGIPFKKSSEYMEAHPLHQLGFRDDDEDETRLDNHRVIMVTSPAILGEGNSDWENYNSQVRVWAKAVVLLEE